MWNLNKSETVKTEKSTSQTSFKNWKIIGIRLWSQRIYDIAQNSITEYPIIEANGIRRDQVRIEMQNARLKPNKSLTKSSWSWFRRWWVDVLTYHGKEESKIKIETIK